MSTQEVSLLPTRPRTSTAEIVTAARCILEAQGLEALTMQAVAHAVGVRGPSLYKRVRDRSEVMRLIANDVLRELAGAWTPWRRRRRRAVPSWLWLASTARLPTPAARRMRCCFRQCPTSGRPTLSDTSSAASAARRRAAGGERTLAAPRGRLIPALSQSRAIAGETCRKRLIYSSDQRASSARE